MVLRKAVEDGFTHFYRNGGQRSAQPPGGGGGGALPPIAIRGCAAL